jgi:hypothetical protein
VGGVPAGAGAQQCADADVRGRRGGLDAAVDAQLCAVQWHGFHQLDGAGARAFKTGKQTLPVSSPNHQCQLQLYVMSSLWQSTATYALHIMANKLLAARMQVDVQLTLRLQGLALLTFGSQAADAVLAALKQQVPALARLDPQVQQVAHYACPDPLSSGIGCRLSAQELTRGARCTLSHAPS